MSSSTAEQPNSAASKWDEYYEKKRYYVLMSVLAPTRLLGDWRFLGLTPRLEVAMNSAFDRWPKKGSDAAKFALAKALAAELAPEMNAAGLHAAPAEWLMCQFQAYLAQLHPSFSLRASELLTVDELTELNAMYEQLSDVSDVVGFAESFAERVARERRKAHVDAPALRVGASASLISMCLQIRNLKTVIQSRTFSAPSVLAYMRIALMLGEQQTPSCAKLCALAGEHNDPFCEQYIAAFAVAVAPVLVFAHDAARERQLGVVEQFALVRRLYEVLILEAQQSDETPLAVAFGRQHALLVAWMKAKNAFDPDVCADMHSLMGLAVFYSMLV